MTTLDVVVSGCGVISACGSNLDEFADSLFSGRSGIGVTKFNNFGWSGDVLAGRVNITSRPKMVSNPRADRVTALAVLAADEAVASSKLDAGALADLRVGVYVGCTLGGGETSEEAYKSFHADKSTRLRPTTVPSVMASASAAELSIRYSAHGPQFTYAMACASGAVAIGEASKAIASGQIDVAIAGGAEAMLTPTVLHSWKSLGVLAGVDARPEESCRPFSLDRSGLVIGEGAAFVLLERGTLRAADRRPRLALVSGYGLSSDAVSLIAPSWEGQVRAVRSALVDSAVSPSSIGYVNAHATATRNGDEVESRAIEAVFAADGGCAPVSSTKALHGHCMGASGAIEVVASILALQQRRTIPAYFVREKDPLCSVRLADGSAFSRGESAVMSNSFGFGGINASLVLRL